MKNAKLEQLLSRHLEPLKATLYAAFEEGKQLGREEGKQRGIEMGVEQERARVLKAINPDATDSAAAGENGASTTIEVPPGAGLAQLVRRMLAHDRKRSFDSHSAAEHFKAMFGTDVTADQMRSVLKVLARSEEAERLERGMYRAGPRLEVRMESTAH